MTVQHFQTAITVVSALCGGYAAWLWYQASKPVVMPDNIEHASPEFETRAFISMANEASKVATILASLEASGEANRRAAIWTAFSVALGALSAIVGVFCSPSV